MMSRAADGTRRLAAATTLVAILAGVPAAVLALTGGIVPDRRRLRNAWTTGRVDDETIVHVGVLLFALLWLWFGVTVLAECAHVLAARRRSGGRPLDLAPVARTPAGGVRRLVRLALISSTAIVGSGIAPLVLRGATGDARASAADEWVNGPRVEVAVALDAGAAAGRSGTVGMGDRTGRAAPADRVVHARARDTPYSIAARLGDASLRERIIAMNHGAVGPDGVPWTGGVLPTGMPVRVPPAASPTTPSAGNTDDSDDAAADHPGDLWWAHVVVAGDSVYSIAAEVARDDSRTVGDVADRIIARNLGRTMLDGNVFADPNRILPGWVLDVPGDHVDADGEAVTEIGAGTVGAEEGHVVVAGESWWRIAEDRLDALGAEPAPATVLAATGELRDHNAPLLGHDDPDLLLPGEVVRWVGRTLRHPAPDAGPARPTPAAPGTSAPAVAPTIASPAVATPPAAETPTVPEAPLAPAATAAPAAAPTATPSTTPAAPVTPAAPDGLEHTGPDASADTDTDTDTDTDNDTDTEDDAGVPTPVAIGATVLLAAGAIGVLEARRREQLRRSSARSRVLAPTPGSVRAEMALRRLDATARAERLDVGLRAAASRLVGLHRHVVAAFLAHDGELTLVLDAPAPAGAPWTSDDGDRCTWRLPAEVGTLELADDARRAWQPCPAIVQLGGLAGAEVPTDVFVDVEAIGLLCLDGGGSRAAVEAFATSIATSMAASPIAGATHTILVGIDARATLGRDDVDHAESLDTALDLAATYLGSTRSVTGGRRTFALRAAAGDGRGELWEPVVIVSAGHQPDDAVAADVVDVAGASGRGLAVIVDRPLPGAPWVVRATRDDPGATWVLEPLGVELVPASLPEHELAAVHELLAEAEVPLLDDADRSDGVGAIAAGVAIADDTIEPPDAAPPFAEPAWELMVRVLGSPSVVDRTGASVEFARAKALELAAWLALHRERPTRTAARTALWEVDVRAASFANVVSDARRAMARLVPPPDGEEWIERTLTEQLPLHPLVVTDADLLRARVEAARRLPAAAAIDVLRPGVELITDLPFAGTSYLWPDAEGTTSALTVLATGAAIELARHHLALGDLEGVFWATGRGMRVLPGHEELIALRMRAHAGGGDLAAVRTEWEVYVRALQADPWSTSEPSPKLLAVHRELLAPARV